MASAALLTAMAQLGAAGDLTAYAYVELTKEAMERKAEGLSQLIAEISSFSGSADAWISREGQLNAGFDGQHEALCANYGVSPEEYLLFYAANEADVESYLDAHPEDRSEIEGLEAQISAALDEFEQLKIDLLELEPLDEEDPLPPGV
ncbi:hypothetical protein Thimo_1755 [Thioflavicoccus mobilis 8321]|uniref:Uncharacterized protein n=2 Tax=Thioflavicoccus mobilis TaxID=80679 RepID=L0GYZ8_9GAMM|nr:hypothetical protein Thimo_1755 [Thioflavicoccus mobilis 8321]